jgi:hypothetical protein
LCLELLLLDDNDIHGGAQHVCDDKNALPTVMAADCPNEYECECCTYCCSSKQICYGEINILQNIDIDFDHTFSIDRDYARDQFIFSENIIFRPTRVAETFSEGVRRIKNEGK